MSERGYGQPQGSQSRTRLQRRDFEPPRDLTEREREVLEFLVSQPFPGHEHLREQIAETRADYGYTNDASISLVVDRDKTQPASVLERVPIIAIGNDPQGNPFSVFVFVDDGYLTYLEIASFGERTMITELPRASTLTVVCAE